ncbi:lamin tail domain-containing protein [Candidatus Pacearchaeota archaeon]|nr:lamin tail domain-containing protein [Candidatus Pacearchaeota archaeon]
MKKGNFKKGSLLMLVISTIILSSQLLLAAVVINEFTAEPKTDWDGSGGNPTTSDEFFELYNSGENDVDVTGWNLSLLNTTESSELLSGFIPAKGYYVIVNPTGSQNNDGAIQLYDNFRILVDSVGYGDYDDGNTADNAPDGNADDVNDECLARINDGKDTNLDKDDFIKTKCSFNATNNKLLIENKNESSCAVENKNVSLSADVAGDAKKVWFTYTINGVNYNKSAAKAAGSARTYRVTIPTNELTEGNINWNVYVNDSNGNTYSNGLRSFYVRSKTNIVTDPMMPDGTNGWYISVPEISLMNVDAAKLFYRWDAGALNQYSGPFFPPANSSGLTKLTWWSQYNCANESMQMQNFKLDLTDPRVKNLIPEENAVLEDNFVKIESLLDDVYHGNSGINKNNVIMKLDNEIVNAGIIDADGDALAKYTAPNLSEGMHTVSIYVEDNAGRSSLKNWMFFVNTSLALVEMNIYSPVKGLYNNKRIPINISLSNEVDELIYVDHAEERPKEKTLCRDCDGFGFGRKRLKSFKDGMHNITFIAIKNGKIAANENVVFTIDSEAPKITEAEPRSGFAQGMFMIEFEEKNPNKVLIYINDSPHMINISKDCIADEDRFSCNSHISLSAFENKKITYWVSVQDIVNNTDESRKRDIVVDTTSPVINSINFTINKRKVHFMIDITEENFDEATYIDLNDPTPRESRLCSRLENGICHASKNFKSGNNNLNIQVIDEAWNKISQDISFTI